MNLIVQFPVFNHIFKSRFLYKIEEIPVSIIDLNKIQIQIKTTSSQIIYCIKWRGQKFLGHQKLKTCKGIGYELYCEVLWQNIYQNIVVKMHHILSPKRIKENLDFYYFFNSSNVKPAVPDDGKGIIWANWPNKIMDVIKIMALQWNS